MHLSVLIGLIALLRAWGYRLNQFELLYSPRGVVEGASFTDVTAELPALKLLVAISIISAVLFLVNIRFRGWTLPLIGVGLWLLTSHAGGRAVSVHRPALACRACGAAEGAALHQRNIQATRRCLRAEGDGGKGVSDRAGHDATDSRRNRTALDNVRLWDPQTLKTAYKQLQEIRTYYQFQDVDVDRYTSGDSNAS